MFTVCQGTCFCAGKAEGFSKPKVLYCFGEVLANHKSEFSQFDTFQAVIERQNIRGDEEGESSVEEDEIFFLQLAQMVVILSSLVAV